LLHLIGSVDHDDSESFLVQLLDHEHDDIAMIAADALGRYRFHSAVEFLKKQVDRPAFASSYGFRFNLVRSLAQMQHPDAVEFLEVLRHHLDGQLRYEIDRLFDDVTEQHFHGDHSRFEQWQQRRQSNIVIQQASYQSETLARLKLARAQKYYGIDINSRRLMFIIDHSGSMRKYAGGMSRLDRAKHELIRAIEELSPDVEFAIAFFEARVRVWQDALMPATEDNKRRAIAFVRRLQCGDSTNTHAALRRALEFNDQLEAVFLLSDGRPTSGELVAPAAIVADILHRNRFRHLKLNTIGIAVGGPTEHFLQSLAEGSAGEYRAAN